MAKKWVLNANGKSFFTAAEQARFDDATWASKPDLRFKAEHGMVASDGDGTLWCGERIVGTWTEVAPQPPPVAPSLPADASGGVVPTPVPVAFGEFVTMLRGLDAKADAIMRALENLHDYLQPAQEPQAH